MILRPAPPLALAISVGLTVAAPLAARQSPASGRPLAEVTATPSSSADAFLRSVRAIRWDTAARLLSDEALDRFRQTVTMIADADRTGDARAFLVQADSTGLAELSSSDIFARAIGAVIDDMPGLMHAMFDRDDEVIGAVAEGDGTAHVVYRTTARISGAVSEVKVMQLRRADDGWRVLWSDELEVLDAALRGIARE